MITMTASKAHFAGIAALLTLSLTGCGVASDVAASVAPAEPRDVLLEAVPDEEVAAYHFDVKGGVTPMSGVQDATKHAVQVKFVQSEPDAGLTMTMSFLVIDKKAWTKISFTPASIPGLPKLPKKWMLLDNSKIKNKDFLKITEETDPGYTANLVDAAAGLTETSPGHYSGTTDLTRSTEADIVDEATLTALGDHAKTVPFEAVVDADGHLTGVTVKIPAAGKTKAQTYAVSYTGFGKTTSPAAPAAGEQQKAVSDVYELLNG
jgi:hypothetical protein